MLHWWSSTAVATIELSAIEVSKSLLFVLLALLLLTTSAHALLRLMHLQSCPRLLRIPLEAFEIWFLELIVRLYIV